MSETAADIMEVWIGDVHPESKHGRRLSTVAAYMRSQNDEITSLCAQLDEARRKAIEECAAIADRWTSPEQRLHGHGGPAAEILALLSESKS